MLKNEENLRVNKKKLTKVSTARFGLKSVRCSAVVAWSTHYISDTLRPFMSFDFKITVVDINVRLFWNFAFFISFIYLCFILSVLVVSTCG